MDGSPHKGSEGNLCGLGSFRPAWLQRFATTNYFLTVYGLLGTIQSMAFIYWVATLTTFEKRFRIPSKTTGLMQSGNEISQILLSLFLSYYGGQRNRPLLIAWGVAFSAASCYVLALPHLLYGPGESALALTKEYMASHSINSTIMELKEKNELCLADKTKEGCEVLTGGEYSKAPALLVFLSQFILGIGSTLYFALGQTYIDDNTKKSRTPLLLGVTLSLRTIGPAFGFLVGYGCLSLYVDPSLTPVIDKKDPRWLGAWWLGWLILGTAMFLFALLMSLFPKNIRRSSSKKPEINKNEIKGKENGDKKVDIMSNGVNKGSLTMEQPEVKPPTLKEFPTALRRIVSNKILVVNIFSGVFYILGGSGYITYLTKYLEVQFNNSAAGASLIIGPVTLISFVLGFLISGIAISKYKPRPLYLLGWNVIVGALMVVAEILFIFIACSNNSIVGYNVLNRSVEVMNQCNMGCGCANMKYAPVCLEESQLTFYTACHAGCQSLTKTNGITTYSNCTCIPSLNVDIPGVDMDINQYHYTSYNGEVKEGACPIDCGYNLIIFVAISFIMHIFGSSGKIGNILVNYRAVRPEDKAFGQGLALLLISLLAFIPGPILFGIIIDSTCLIWDQTCGTSGNCWFYDKEAMRVKMNITAAAFTIIGVVLDGVVCYLGQNLELYREEEAIIPPKTDTVETKETKTESDNEEGPLKYSYLQKSP